MNGKLQIVEDVGRAYAELAATTYTTTGSSSFVLGCSGGASGKACLDALVQDNKFDWSKVTVVFADERCVPADSPDANVRLISKTLGAHRDELAALLPMVCQAGPGAYEEQLRSLPPIDLLQLGLGPDGHTASLFPGSAGLDAPRERLVTANRDPSGNNPYERMSLTYAGIARARRVVITAIGAARAEVVARIASGDDLPAGRVTASDLLWLIDEAAASLLPDSVTS